MEDGFKTFYRDILHKELEGALPEALTEKYTLDSCLSYGDTSETYLVTRREDGAKAVLRISKLRGGEDAQAEYDTLRRLHHPAIPEALDVVTADGRGYLVRSYMEGHTLRRYVELYGPLGEAEMIDIASALCDILEYLQAQNPPVIHRDLKPDNIVIDPEGNTRLIDFGIARAFREEATSDTIAIGTRSYMAPEQFGGTQTDARADVYGLGVVMVYMGTQSPDRTNLRHRFPYKALLPVVQRCIEYDPERRYRSGAAVKHALQFVRRGGWRRVAKIAGTAAIALVIAGGSFFAGERIGYDRGYGSGHWVGVEAGSGSGYQQGLTEGQSQGYEQGFEAGLAESERMRAMGLDVQAPQLFDQAWDVPRGNTNANHINGGLCATDGTFIYYAVDMRIERMTMEGASISVLCNREGKNLNYYEGHLYFTGSEGVYRVQPDGGELTVISEARFDRMFIVDGVIYGTNTYDSLSLYHMGLEGGEPEKLSDQSYTYYLNIENDRFVYADGGEGNHLYSMPLDGGEATLLDDADAHWINVVGDYAYYTLYGSSTALLRIRLDGTERTEIAKASPAYTNITEYGIFYAEGYDSNKLYWMPLNGNGPSKVVDAKVANINVAGQWVFFQNRSEGDVLYRMRTDGEGLTRVNAP